MSKIIFDCAISLDGFFAGDNRSPENPMGGPQLARVCPNWREYAAMPKRWRTRDQQYFF